MVNIIAARRIIQLLNHAIKLDPVAIRQIFLARFPCNDAMALHPSIQVTTEDGTTTVGLLGLLNGICGVYESGPYKDWGPITAIFVDEQLDRFELTSEQFESQNCRACGCDIRPMFMLHDELWLSMANKHDYLCRQCVESAMGRPLEISDFKFSRMVEEAQTLIEIALRDGTLNQLRSLGRL